ncbi:MAG: hypothetical protein IKR58_02630 [Lachnospiraceae bacterium]|nr:hypothetical protein [Lachnospiraceae bacterium]
MDPIYDSMKEMRELFAKEKPQMLAYIDALAFLHLGISLMYRLYESEKRYFNRILKRNTDFLDACFPLWRKNNCILLSYVISHRSANLKLWIVRTVYRLHLFKAFLWCYTTMIRRLHIDIKW